MYREKLGNLAIVMCKDCESDWPSMMTVRVEAVMTNTVEAVLLSVLQLTGSRPLIRLWALSSSDATYRR